MGVARRLTVARFEVHLVSLDPTRGSEIRKTRPCVVISPDEVNRHLRTVIVAPMTSRGGSYPSRVPVKFQGTDGHVVLDQIRTVDKVRLARRVGLLDEATSQRVVAVLVEMFAP
jgi:mRNA interferase MazF